MPIDPVTLSLGLGIAEFGFGIFSKIFGGKKAKKEARRAREREMAFQMAQARAAQNADIEKIKEMTALNKSRTELFEAAEFQKGSVSGPYFQMVRK